MYYRFIVFMNVCINEERNNFIYVFMFLLIKT